MATGENGFLQAEVSRNRGGGAWAAATVLLALLLSACDAHPAGTPDEATLSYQRPVRVVEIGESDAVRELRLPGIVRAVQRAEPAFLHAGYLAERFVTRGDRVVAGERLATLQNPGLGPALALAEARVREQDERITQFEADYQRARELHAKGLGSAELLDRSLAQRNAAREARAQALAGVAEARDQLADAVLRAPFDATVGDLLVEPGDFVAAGQPILVLAGEGGLEIEVKLPEGLARRLNPGDLVEVRAPVTGAHTEARIRELGVARAGRPTPAVVALPDVDDWEPGISAHVTITFAAGRVLTVPLGAIVDPGMGQARVFRIVDGRAVMTPVAVGRLVGARVEVTGALSPGDLVVVAGHQQLLDGEPVKVLP